MEKQHHGHASRYSAIPPRPEERGFPRSLMKLIFAALLGLIATNALAWSNTKAVAYSKEFGASLIAAACDAKTHPVSTVSADGSVRHVYTASTEVLHHCQYFRDISDSGCAQTGNCLNYEDFDDLSATR